MKARIEEAALRQAFAAKIRTYDELTSSQVRETRVYGMLFHVVARVAYMHATCVSL